MAGRVKTMMRFKAVVIEMVVTVLRRLCKRGSVVKSGTSRDAQWALAPAHSYDVVANEEPGHITGA